MMELKKAIIKMEFEFEEPDRWICDTKVFQDEKVIASVLVYGSSIPHACEEAMTYINYIRRYLQDTLDDK